MKFRWSPLVLALALAGCSKPSVPEDVARNFFDFIVAGKAAQAYAGTTFSFQAQQSEKFFETTLQEMGLDAIASVKYEQPGYSSDRRVARIPAEFTTKTKSIIRLVIALVDEGGVWKIHSLKTPRDPTSGRVENHFTLVGRDPKFGDPTAVHSPPDEGAVKAMTLKSLLAFNDAVKSRNFVPLFNECSLHWQDQLVTREGAALIPGTMRRDLTPRERELGAARLQHAFSSFIDQQIDIAGIDGIEPVFDRPAWVNTDALLVVSGYYPTKPYRVLFALKFYYEVPAWRLFGLDVSVKKADGN